ncbi:MAG: FAD:protein FMN transferase [Candidatus Falkowbacteria bacterium]|nr:FAD:protein FMN transferase [Candidatus Falkowbacteria bacterium]
MSITWRKFNALGTEIILSAALSSDQAVLLDTAEEKIKIFENSFSRFIKGNELDNFNRSTDKEIEVSEDMFVMLVEAKKWYDFSQGIFDPTIIDNLEKLGYDRSFTELTNNDSKIDLEKIKQDFLQRPKLDQLIISGNKVSKPAALRLDFGGFGKGYIVDLIAKDIFSNVANYWISAGGDLLAAGNQDNQVGWRIGVQNPYEPNKEIFSLNTKGIKLGVATSGVWQRQGIKDNKSWNHIIDPRSGISVENDILAVTALADSATKADILAKIVLILGETAGLEFISKQANTAALIFLKNGAIVFSSEAKKYL